MAMNQKNCMMKRDKVLTFFNLTFLLFMLWVPHASAQEYEPYSVRVIYVVSADRVVNPLYKAAIKMAVKDIRKWFNSNPIENMGKDNWGFYNTLNEVQRILGVDALNVADFTWVIYSDGPGNTGRGGGGICYMPEDDLLGLIGYHPKQPDVPRWIAGLGHELGHAFGLPHPADVKKDADAIMWTGIYGKYPDQTYLTPQDKEILRKSPFFNEPPKVLSRSLFDYAGGTFVRLETDRDVMWEESKDNSNVKFSFAESRFDEAHYVLEDVSRGMFLKIPRETGYALWSGDSGKTWNNLYWVVPQGGK